MEDQEQRSCSASGCKRVDDDEMVACENCKRWWHYSCHNFEADKFDTVTPWFCEEKDCVFREDEDDSKKNSSSGPAAPAKVTEEQVDLIMEAAAVAQATVAQRDKELLELRAELADTKLKLSQASRIKAPPIPNAKDNLSSLSIPNSKLEIIKKIQANHQALVNETIANGQSTPLRENTTGKPANVHISAKETSEEHSSGSVASFRDLDMANLLTILNRNNVQELPIFSGENKREWPYFEEVYKSTTIEGRYSAKENVSRLRKVLRGEAYQLVSERLKYSSDADAIMDSLRSMFGRYDILIHDLTADLLSLPKLTSRCDPKLRLWAAKLNGFVADVKSINREEDLNNGYVLTNLASRLGGGLYHDWQKRKSALPLANFEHFAAFLSQRVLDLPPDLSKPGGLSEQKKLNPGSKSSRVLLHQPVSSDTSSGLCCKCNKVQHSLIQCVEFLALSPEQRQTFAREKSICFACLDPSKHQWKQCFKKRSCGTDGCNRRHHPLLHASPSTSSAGLSSTAVPFIPQHHIHSSHVGIDLTIMFKIVPIRIYGNDDVFFDTHAFLDDGSSLSMIEEDLFNQLGLSGHPEQLTLQWTKGVSRVEDSKRTSLEISGVNHRKKYILKNVYTIKDLGLASQSVDVGYLKSLYPHLRGLPIRDLKNARPQILLGLDQAKFLLGHGQRHGNEEEPHALKTLLGWIVYGKSAQSMNVSCLHQVSKPSMVMNFHDAIRGETDLHDLVRRHFTTEEFGVMPPKGQLLSREVARSLDIMERTIKLVGNQYEIGLLWDKDDVRLPDSYEMAFKRLIALEKSLKKKPHMLEWQNRYFHDLVSKGYARIATQEDLEKVWPRVWYAPTFIIVNPNKNPPKPRCVADVAAKINGVSLNTHLLKGPDNLVPLHAGIFKFREQSGRER